MRELSVDLLNNPYSVLIGDGAVFNGADRLRDCCTSGRAAVVSDETVWGLHGDMLQNTLSEAGVSFCAAIVSPGENSKTLDTLGRLYAEFARFGLRREDTVIAFGGGVVGDVAGFASATYMRGVRLLQIPTTLLAQVDSSVGGKVAVNLPEGKNLVGSFWQPCMVIADTGLLSTLPEREWLAGMAEVVKYAAIGEEALLPYLASRDSVRENIGEIVLLCCKRKAWYVERDERDTGLRMALNFGHSFGHAIEKYHTYSGYNHGEAVAIGMALAARAGELMGLTGQGTCEALKGIMDSVGLSYRLEDGIEDIIPLMSGDKKNCGDELTLVLLKRIGVPIIHRAGRRELLEAFGRDGDG